MDQSVTLILQAASNGDAAAHEQLLRMIYRELRALAQSKMRAERAGHTLQATALVNEAYLRLDLGDVEWQNRAHFFGAAAEAMRRVLVDHARRHGAHKRGAGVEHVTFDDMGVAADDPALDVLELDQALSALSAIDPRLAHVVTLRYFAGLGIEETARVLEVAPATVKRDWVYARAWLYERMRA